MSFFRHEEIYRPMDSKNVPGRSWHDRPRPHRYDEFPAGYSSAGCAPAEPASASPAEAHLAGIGSGSTIELQRAVNRLLTPCLTQGDNPTTEFADTGLRSIFVKRLAGWESLPCYCWNGDGTGTSFPTARTAKKRSELDTRGQQAYGFRTEIKLKSEIPD